MVLNKFYFNKGNNKMLKNITSLYLCLFLFSCSDLQDAAKNIDKGK